MGLPKIESIHKLPDDLLRFYELCGGITLYVNMNFGLTILSPEEFRVAKSLFWEDEVIEKAKDTLEVSASSNWYTVVDLYEANYITIDLHPKRLGRCYKAFWGNYGVVGETPILALSFTELFERLINDKGECWYFLQQYFVSRGDAFDGIKIG